MRIIPLALAAALVAGGAAWWLSAPRTLPAGAMAEITGDAARGEQVFHATGCASCHMAPGARGDAQLVLAGGQKFPSDFGTFIAPNISPDREHGIGDWRPRDLANALMHGVGASGQHLYPALPYAAYQHMSLQEVADLHAYLMTLPPSAEPSAEHEVGFPFSLRRGLGLWKLIGVPDEFVLQGALTPEEIRGRHLVEGLAHCAECHTPRNAIGVLDRDRWLQGAPNPSGRGQVPGITPDQLGWSKGEIVEYLRTGFTPDYDSAGGHMAHVVENFAALPEADAEAVAAYLLKLPATR